MKTAIPDPQADEPARLREAWVQQRLIQSFMRSAWPALHAVVILILVISLVLYPHVARLGLALWMVSVIAVTLARYRVVWLYRRDMQQASGAPLEAFMRRYTWIWFMSGLIWGALNFIFLLRVPAYDQFLCMLVMIGLGGFAVGAFSSSLPCFTGFVNGMGMTAVSAIAWQLAIGHGQSSSFNLVGLLVIAMVYWIALYLSGQRFHHVHRATLEVQYDNETLIASLRETSRAAVEAVAIKNRFIASAAHDLRQPVHALDLYAGWLMAEPEFVEQIAPKIVRSTKAVAALFDSLFDLAGLESDPLRVHLQQVDLAVLIRDLEEQYAPLAAERGLRLRTRVTPLKVNTDPVLLKRLVGNLVSNALRNTRQGGVLLATRHQGNDCLIDVWDTGVGISPEHQQAIFQEFYRIPMQGTEEGFGLGLAIVSRLSDALGYPVSLKSRVGRGSLFRVVMSRDCVAG